MADAYGAGLAFKDFLTKTIPGKIADASYADRAGFHQSMADIHGFLSGLTGGAQPSVNVQLPPATPAKGAPAASKAPAAATAKAAATPSKDSAAADPLAGLGGLSLRQFLTLSQASENLTPKGSVRPTPTADAAGELLLKMTLPSFQNTLAAAKTDDDKQKVIDNYRDQVLLPIISHGNPMAGMFDPQG